MSWHDQLIPAKIGNIDFLIKSHDAQFGRRTQTHSFPNQDQSYTQDLGKSPRQLNIQGYLLGDAYAINRDALIALSEAESNVTLHHPYLGVMQVVLKSLKLKEQTDQGRIAQITLSLCEQGDTPLLKTSINSQKQLTDQVVITQASSRSVFEASFINTPSNLIRSHTQSLADQLSEDLGVAIDIRSNLYDQIESGLKAVNNPISFFGWGDVFQTIEILSTPRKIQAQNQQNLIQSVQTAAVIEAVQNTITQDKKTDQTIHTIQTKLTELSNLSTDHHHTLTLNKLQVLLSQSQFNQTSNLLALEVATQTPALVLAYRFLNDANQDQNLTQNQPFSHPLLMAKKVKYHVS